MCAKLLQSCLTLCNSTDCSPPGSSVHGIFPARMLEWVAISAPIGSSQPRDQTHVSCVSCTAGRFFISEPPGKPPNRHKRRNHTIIKQFTEDKNYFSILCLLLMWSHRLLKRPTLKDWDLKLIVFIISERTFSRILKFSFTVNRKKWRIQVPV